MAFTKIEPTGAIAAKGRWAVLMNATQNAKLKLETAKRSLGLHLTVSGNTAGAKNRATLAKVLADTPAIQTPRATNSKSTPSSTAANKARLAAILADD